MFLITCNISNKHVMSSYLCNAFLLDQCVFSMSTSTKDYLVVRHRVGIIFPTGSVQDSGDETK